MSKVKTYFTKECDRCGAEIPPKTNKTFFDCLCCDDCLTMDDAFPEEEEE